MRLTRLMLLALFIVLATPVFWEAQHCAFG